MSDPSYVQKSWHLEKGVSIGLILAALIQTGSFVWWAATLENRVSNLESGRSDRLERFYKLEQLVEQNTKSIDRLIQIIERQRR